MPTGAHAADWSISGSASTRFEADTDRGSGDDSGPIYGATARLGIAAQARTPRSTLSINTGVSARGFGGSGDAEGLSGTYPDFHGSYAYNGKYIDAGTDLSVQYQPVSFAQIDDTGLTEGDALQFTVRLGSHVAYAVSPRDRVTAGANLSLIRFSKGETDLRPTTTIGGTLGWSRDLSRATSWNLQFGARRFKATEEPRQDRMTFDLTTGLQHQFTPRLSLGGDFGVTATEVDGYELGLTGGLAGNWRPTSDTSFSLTFSHGIQPSSVGDLRKTTSIGLGMFHEINSWIDTAFSVGWSRRSAIGDETIARSAEEERDQIQFGSSINFALARAWSLGVGYGLTYETESGDNTIGNRVFMQVTRRFTILP